MFDEREADKFELAADMVALERQLASLSPAEPRIDRDRLMFAAGQAAAGVWPRWPVYLAGPFWAGSRFWPAATATMTAATVLLATMLVWQRHAMSVAQQTAKSPATGPQLVIQPRATGVYPASRLAASVDGWSITPPATSGYLGVRYVALTRGIAALEPLFQPSDGDGELIDRERTHPATARGLLNELLPITTDSTQTRS